MYKIGNYKISQNLAHTHTVLPPPLNALRRRNYGGKMFHRFLAYFVTSPLILDSLIFTYWIDYLIIISYFWLYVCVFLYVINNSKTAEPIQLTLISYLPLGLRIVLNKKNQNLVLGSPEKKKTMICYSNKLYNYSSRYVILENISRFGDALPLPFLRSMIANFLIILLTDNYILSVAWNIEISQIYRNITFLEKFI